MSDDYIFEMSACNGNGKKPDFKNLKDPLGATEANIKAFMFSDSLLERGFDMDVVTKALFRAAAQVACDHGKMEDFKTMINNFADDE